MAKRVPITSAAQRNRWINLGSAQRKLKEIPAAAKAEIWPAIAAGADEIVAMQKRLAPVKTGKLRDSIQWRRGTEAPQAYASLKGSVRGDPEMSAIVSAGNEECRIAHLVEFGTAPHPQGGMFEGTDHPGTAPQPFFYPAVRALRRRAKSRVTRAANKAAKKVAGKA